MMDNVSIVNDQQCRGCGVCAAVCPAGAVSLVLDESGFFRACVSPEQCVECGKCASVCGVLQNRTSNNAVKTVYCVHEKDPARRMLASSGGAVGAIVRAALEEEYTVLGAAYDYLTNRVRHIEVASIDEYYDRIAGSKYIPSNTVDAFKSIKDRDRVLVIGTPCQIQSLKKAYPNKEMLCIDFRCYGVCGYTLWDKYLDIIQRPGVLISKINMRSKRESWLNWGIEIDYDNGCSYFQVKTKDPFGKIFSGFENVGAHCLKCDMAEKPSFADIRVEDAWNLGSFLTEDDYKHGASQVTVMTDAGARVFEKAKTWLEYIDVGKENAFHSVRKQPYKEQLNQAINNPEKTILDAIYEYNQTIPLHKRIFTWSANLLLDMPGAYFFAKKVYRKLRSMK